MQHDPTENIRRARQAALNNEAGSRAELEAIHGQVWDSGEVRKRWKVIGFMAPLVVVKDRKTGAKGSLEFQHLPRYYFNYQTD
jgi:hypothetical protein